MCGRSEMVMGGRKEQLPLHDHLRKTLSPFDGVCVILSIMIGSGIFASPGPLLLLTLVSPPKAWSCSELDPLGLPSWRGCALVFS
jgi:hypothetical protein